MRMTGQELTDIRKFLRLSQTALADKLGVNLSTVWRWEKEQLPILPRAALAIEKLKADAEAGENAA